MPCTGLRVVSAIDGNEKNIKFITAQIKDQLEVCCYLCNDKFVPVGSPITNYMERNEEEYHRELRAAAKKKKQLVTSESTNPEWNE